MRLPPAGTPLAAHETQCLIALADAATSLGIDTDGAHEQLEPFLPYMPINRRLEMICALGNADNHRSTQPRRYRLLSQVEALSVTTPSTGAIREQIHNAALAELMLGLTSPHHVDALGQCLNDLERFPADLHGRGLANIVEKVQYDLSSEDLRTVYAAKLATFDELQVADFIAGCGADGAVLESGGLLEAVQRLSVSRRASALSELASCYPDSETLSALRVEILGEIAALPCELRAEPLERFAESKAELHSEFSAVLGLAASVPLAARKPIIDILIYDLANKHSEAIIEDEDLYATLLQESLFPNLALHNVETRSAMLRHIGCALRQFNLLPDQFKNNFAQAVNALPQDQRPPAVMGMAENLPITPIFAQDAHEIYALAEHLAPNERALVGVTLARSLGNGSDSVLDHIVGGDQLYASLAGHHPDLQAPLITVIAGRVMRGALFESHSAEVLAAIAALPHTHRPAPLAAMASNVSAERAFSHQSRMILNAAEGLSAEQMMPIYSEIIRKIHVADDANPNVSRVLRASAGFSKTQRGALLSTALAAVESPERFLDPTGRRTICEAVLHEVDTLPNDDRRRLVTRMFDALINTDRPTFAALRNRLETELVTSWLN